MNSNETDREDAPVIDEGRNKHETMPLSLSDLEDNGETGAKQRDLPPLPTRADPPAIPKPASPGDDKILDKLTGKSSGNFEAASDYAFPADESWGDEEPLGADEMADGEVTPLVGETAMEDAPTQVGNSQFAEIAAHESSLAQGETLDTAPEPEKTPPFVAQATPPCRNRLTTATFSSSIR